MAERIFLPLVFSGPKYPPPGLSNKPQDGFRFGYEQDLYLRIKNDPEQGRENPTTHPRLVAAARKRVVAMAYEGWSGHVDPEGHGPDWYIRQQGYKLPSYYYVAAEGDRSNHVESLNYGGWWGTSVDEIWDGLMGDKAHRDHILGQGWFSAQTCVGIGVFYMGESVQKQYVSIISAPPPEGS